MLRRSALFLALTALVVASGPAGAVTGTIDNVPASTLLLPYFEVAPPGSGSNLTTLFEINNASAAPAIAHVTLWTNWSIPTLDFNVFLTGYDVVPINVRDIFDSGVVPPTTPLPTTNHGIFSLPNDFGISIAACADQLPLPPLPALLKQHINAWHAGLQSPATGNCAGASVGGNLVGYITVDNVFSCTLAFPGTAGYFGAGGVYRTGDNMLWGNYYYVDPDNNFAQGETLVHLESTLGLGQGGDYTFYGRYTSPALDDDVEPLASLWAARYLTGGAFTGGTELIVWRDNKLAVNNPVTCGTTPAWVPLQQTQIVVFDEDENPEVPSQNFSGDPDVGIIPFPYETQSVTVGGPSFPVSFSGGWIFLNLNWTVTGGFTNPEMQNFVSTVLSAEGRFSVGFDAIQLDSVYPVGDSSGIVLSEP